MPQSKTIEIDEVLPNGEGIPTSSNPQREPNSENPFSDFTKNLPWKAKLTLKLTSWFILLKSKPWGRWVTVPAIILAILLAVPLGFLAILYFSIRSIIRSLTAPNHP